MISFDEARAKICALTSETLAAERVSLTCPGGLVGRVLREPLVAKTQVPPFSHSMMDGYAVSTRDVAALPSRLSVCGESKAGGTEHPVELAPGSAMRIFTGAPLPQGADAVVMQEHVRSEPGWVTFDRPVKSGQYIRFAGADLAEGAVAVAAGTRLSPMHVSMAAALDAADVLVSRKPRVGLLASGDELRAPGTSGPLGTIADALSGPISALIERAGGTVVAKGCLGDDEPRLRAWLDDAVSSCDVVITLGGVSVGDHDLIKPALVAAGATVDFWKIAIKPGKPLLVGRARQRSGRLSVVLGLPGNPVSALVTFALFGAPVLRLLQGDLAPFPPTTRARLTHAARHEPGRLEFARAKLTSDDTGQQLVELLANQASGAVLSMVEGNALVMLDAAREAFPAGEVVDVLAFSNLFL